MLEIKVGTVLHLPGHYPRSVNYIDLRPAYCGICHAPFVAVRLLMEDGVLTLCRDDHAEFRSYVFIHLRCRMRPLGINLRGN